MSAASRQRPWWRDDRALTLTELVVYCFLLAAFSVTAFLSLPVHTGRQVADLEHAAGESSILMTRIGQELANGSRGSVQISTEPPGVMFLSAVPSQGEAFQHRPQDAAILWQGWVGFFWQDETVVRAYQPLSAPMVRSEVETRPSPTQLLAQESRPVAREVRAFAAQREASGAVTLQVRVEEAGTSMDLETSVAARNP